MATYIPQKNEDSIAASGDKGVPILGVSNEAGSAKTADGDYGMLSINTKGEVYVNIKDISAGTQTNDVKVTLDGETPSLAVEKTQDAVASTGAQGIPILGYTNEAGAALASASSGDWNYLMLDRWGRLSANINDISAGTQTNDVKITLDSETPSVQGIYADDSSSVANPIGIAGKAATSTRTNVTAGDTVIAQMDTQGRLTAVPTLRQNIKHNNITITSSTTETTLLAAEAGVYLDLVSIVVANTSATGTYVTFKDATAGTTRTVLYVPAAETRGVVFSDAPITQATANNNWTATSSASVASLYITAVAHRFPS